MRQALIAMAITALAFILLNLGWYVGGIIGGLIWCTSIVVMLVGIGWLLGLVLNYKEWF